MARSRGRSDIDYVEQPSSDAYVGMLVIALAAQLIGILLLFLDYTSTPDVSTKVPERPNPPSIQVNQPGGGGAGGP